jgi:hypothetical protein
MTPLNAMQSSLDGTQRVMRAILSGTSRGGKGFIHRRQMFALWTCDEHPATELDGRIDKAQIPADAYACTAVPGATVLESCRGGAEIASEINRPVVFVANGILVVVHPGADPKAVANDWWRRMYGKSWEQSLSER